MRGAPTGTASARRRTCPGGIAGRLAALVAAVTVTVTVVDAPPAEADTAYVTISGNAFSPASVRVQKGPAEQGFPEPHAHVVFVMSDQGTEHRVVFDDPAIPPSRTLTPGQIHDAVFTAAGTYPYGCSIHPSMRGTVVVTEMPAPTTTTTTTTAPPPTTSATAVPGPAPTAPPSTPAPTTARPAARAPAARATTTAAPATTTATTAPSTTAASSTTTAATSTSTTTPTVETTTPGDEEVVATADGRRTSSSPTWPRAALLVVVLAAVLGAVLAGARARRRPGVDRAD